MLCNGLSVRSLLTKLNLSTILNVFKALDKKPSIEWIEMPDNIKKQYQYFTEASLNNLREKTGYTEEFSTLEEGVNDYVKNFLLSESRAYL